MHAQPPPFEGPRQPGAGMNHPNGNFGGPPPMSMPMPMHMNAGAGPSPRPVNPGGNGFNGAADHSNQSQLHQRMGNMNLNDAPSRPSDNTLKAYLGKSVGFRIRPHEEKAKKAGDPPKLNWARAEKSQMYYPNDQLERMIDETEPKGNVMAQQDSLDTSTQRKAVDQAVGEWRDQETDRRFSWDLVCVVVKRLRNPAKAMMSRNQRERPVREIRIVLQRVLAEPIHQSSMGGAGKGKEGAHGGRDGPGGMSDQVGNRPGPQMGNPQAHMNNGNTGHGNMHHGGPSPMHPMNPGPPMMPPNHGPPPMHQNNGPPPMHQNNGPPPMHQNNGPPPMNMNGPNGFNRPPPPPPPQNFPPVPNGQMNGPPFPRPPMGQMPPPGRPMPRPDEPVGIQILDDDDDEPLHMPGGRPPRGHGHHGQRPPPIVTDSRHMHRHHGRHSPSASRSRSHGRRHRRHRSSDDIDAFSRSSIYSSEDDVFSSPSHSPRSFGSPLSSAHASLASSSRARKRSGAVEYHRGRRGEPHSAVWVRRRPSTSSKSYHGRGSAYGRASSDFDHVSDDEELGYRRRRRHRDQESKLARHGSLSASDEERSRRRRRAERERPYRDDRLGRDYERYEDRRRYGTRRDDSRSGFLG